VNPAINILNPQRSATHFEAVDCKNPDYYIAGQVNGGVLLFVIVTKNLATGARSTIPAKDFFDAMMDYFYKCGIVINKILGDWNDMHPLYTTNLDQFNAAINANPVESDEIAVMKTFTGRMA